MTENSLNSKILQVESLKKSFGKLEVVKGISFDLMHSEILGIIGPSGEGKTTLLRCLDLLETLSEGKINYFNEWQVSKEIDGDEIVNNVDSNINIVDSQKAKMMIRQQIGFVFQNINLWEEKTVLKNLIVGPTIVQKRQKNVAIDDAIKIANQFGLKDKINSKGWELSGGQKQRVAIIRALLMHPKLILLDEITSALDPVLTLEVLLAIKELSKKGPAMVVVTHHMEFASSLCDRMMFLSKGRAIQIDTPKNLKNKPKTKEVSEFLEVLKSTR